MQQGAHARGVVGVVPTVTLTESHDAEDLMEQMEAKLGPFIDGFTGTVAQRHRAYSRQG